MWFFLSRFLWLQSVLTYYTRIIITLDHLHVTLTSLLNSIAIAFLNFFIEYVFTFSFQIEMWKRAFVHFFFTPKHRTDIIGRGYRSLQHNDRFHQALFRFQRGKIIFLCLPRHNWHGFFGIFFSKIDISANTIQTFQTVEFWGGKISRPCYIYIN